MPPHQTSTPPQPLQSFKPYSGKAPAIIQIVGGLLWLGAAALIIFGLLNILPDPISGVLYLVIAAIVIVTAKSLFSMKKVAFRNTIVTAVLILISMLYSSFTQDNFAWANLLAPILMLFVAFYYRNQFVN